jgi:hypothetical protein
MLRDPTKDEAYWNQCIETGSALVEGTTKKLALGTIPSARQNSSRYNLALNCLHVFSCKYSAGRVVGSGTDIVAGIKALSEGPDSSLRLRGRQGDLLAQYGLSNYDLVLWFLFSWISAQRAQ